MGKSLDKELESALRATDSEDDGATGPVVAPKAAPRPPPRGGRSIGLLIGLLVMAGGVVGVALFGFKEAAIYALPADQLVSRADELTGRRVRVEGELVPGTLAKRDEPCEYRFRMKSGEAELPVRYPQCVVPDTFRDRPEGGVQVTVEGTLEKSGDFKATLVMAKCTSKYDPETHEIIEPDGTRRKAPAKGEGLEAADQPIR
jgi:cytochrome c-type biogenesis protein CcmE